MPIFESLSLSSAGKIISAIWANGSRFLWSVALACVVAAAALRVSAYYAVPKAQPWWDEYGLSLMLGAAVVSMFAIFKTWAERNNTELFLIADEAQSFWHHAKQPNGLVLTQFSLQFHVTNRAGHGLILSKVRILRPRIKRRQIWSASLMTEGGMNDAAYSGDRMIPPRGRRACHASLMVRGVIGGEGRKKPMQVKIAVQDNLTRWHKLTFIDLRDPQAGPQ
jgi:hypothetical protein